jgi:hypothetical protein
MTVHASASNAMKQTLLVRSKTGSALDYVLHGLAREHQPKSNDTRVRDRERIDRLIADKRRPLEDRTLWSMLYSTAAR